MKNQLFYSNSYVANPRNALTTEAETVLIAINKFRCIRVEQIEYFIPTMKLVREEYHKVICKHLSIQHLANLSGDYIFALNESNISQEMIDSIWVAISIIQESGETATGDILKNAFKSVYPCTISFILDKKKQIKILPVLTENDVVNIMAESDKYLSSTTDKIRENNLEKLLYVIAIRNPELLSTIGDINPPFPHKIAVLDGNYNEKPSITYYSK